MDFRLERQKESTKALSVFRVLDSANATVGTITVPRGQESDLLRHWKGPTAARAATPSVPSVKLPKLSKQALLRS